MSNPFHPRESLSPSELEALAHLAGEYAERHPDWPESANLQTRDREAILERASVEQAERETPVDDQPGTKDAEDAPDHRDAD